MFVRTTAINKILKLTKRIKAIQGGTSAGKTYGILPILIDKALKKKGLEISVVAESVPHLKRGVIKDFKKILESTKRWNREQWHSTDSRYTFSNGSYIEFFSADDNSKLRGARRDILYINEANNVSFESYSELSVRTKGEVYLDWNPTHRFWFNEHLENDKDVDFLILTYLDNESCPDSAIEYILKAKEKAETSEYWDNWYKVYGLGQTGMLQGTVFTNWREGTFDTSLPFAYGLDFGFSPDPTALTKVAVDKKNKMIYVEEKAYLKELSTSNIVSLLREHTEQGSLIVADCAEKRLINDLINERLNVSPCRKGKDSIKTGIKNMQDYTIIVCGNSPNLKVELNNYIWNGKAGMKAGIPIDNYNHLIDGIRYVFDRLTQSVGLL